MTKYDDYEMTIGIECHVQLDTKTKLFSAANNDSRFAEPNQNVTPIDYGLPGMLPVLNRQAVVLAVKAAKALNSEVAKVSSFDRKHYFYPDLPKGYQTTQMNRPTIGAGFVEAPLGKGKSVRVRIHHAHIEEDAGKLSHFGDYSLVDLNRAGTPLIEIVSEPDIHSAEEAKAYASELHKLMVFAGVTKGDLYHGNMRFDVNISVAKKGATELGKRAEIKNLNSFRSVERAAEYEFKRQVDLIESGEKVIQETRGWNDDKQITTSQRSKEDAQDYRYMPDPDIPPIVLSEQRIEEIQATVPLLPNDYRSKWGELQPDDSVTESILNVPEHAVLLVKIQDEAGDKVAKKVAHWLSSALSHSESDVPHVAKNNNPAPYIELAKMVLDNELSSSNAKEIFLKLFMGEDNPRQIAKQNNMVQNSDSSAIEAIVDEVLADPASQKAISDIQNGNDKAIGYLVGQVMKKSKGQANPAMTQKIIRNRL